MKKIIGNFYWTERGIGYRVDSYSKARRYNKIAAIVAICIVFGILAACVYMFGFHPNLESTINEV